MPSCYLLCYHGAALNRRILVSRKNIIGFRCHGNPIIDNRRFGKVNLGAGDQNIVIWNNAGQIAISGGARDGDADCAIAAEREFFEETSIDFRNAGVRLTHGVLARGIQYFGGGAADNNCTYACRYVQINPGNANALRTAINTAIGNNTTEDDEVRTVDWVSPNAPGFAVTPTAHNDAGNLVDASVAVDNVGVNWRSYQIHLADNVNQPLVANANQRRNWFHGRLGGSFDWFQDCVDNLP